MFGRFHSLIALLSVALHLVDLVVAAGHTHQHGPGDVCATACAGQAPAAKCSHRHEHEHHGHAHSNSACHSHAAPCGPAPSNSRHSHPDSKPHHDCAICQHLALTPALVSPAAPGLSPAGSEPVLGEVAKLLPPLRIVDCRSRAPPASQS